MNNEITEALASVISPLAAKTKLVDECAKPQVGPMLTEVVLEWSKGHLIRLSSKPISHEYCNSMEFVKLLWRST